VAYTYAVWRRGRGCYLDFLDIALLEDVLDGILVFVGAELVLQNRLGGAV
jgi:hypothetical protein